MLNSIVDSTTEEIYTNINHNHNVETNEISDKQTGTDEFSGRTQNTNNAKACNHTESCSFEASASRQCTTYHGEDMWPIWFHRAQRIYRK